MQVKAANQQQHQQQQQTVTNPAASKSSSADSLMSLFQEDLKQIKADRQTRLANKQSSASDTASSTTTSPPFVDGTHSSTPLTGTSLEQQLHSANAFNIQKHCVENRAFLSYPCQFTQMENGQPHLQYTYVHGKTAISSMSLCMNYNYTLDYHSASNTYLFVVIMLSSLHFCLSFACI